MHKINLVSKLNTPLGYVQEKYIPALCEFGSIRWNDYNHEYIVVGQLKNMRSLPQARAMSIKRHVTRDGDCYFVLAKYHAAQRIKELVFAHLNAILNMPEGESVPIEMVWDVLFSGVRDVSYRGVSATVDSKRMLAISGEGLQLEKHMMSETQSTRYGRDSFDDLLN